MIDELNSFIQKIENFDKLKSSEQVDFLAYFLIFEHKQLSFTASQIGKLFNDLRQLPYSNIPKYLNDNSIKAKGKKKKFIKLKDGFHFVSTYENEIAAKIKTDEVQFINFSIDKESLNWKVQDIPFLNSKIKKDADFFVIMYYLLYHLENSIRKFLKQRLSSILGNDWEQKIIQEVELTKAESIRKDTNLSEMIQDRGDSILYYCMWGDYGKILKKYPNIFSNTSDQDEIIAHLNSIEKIRNAIAHNTATIPEEYQDELTVFISKYIRVVKKYDKNFIYPPSKA